jgi:hypothetical protein
MAISLYIVDNFEPNGNNGLISQLPVTRFGGKLGFLGLPAPTTTSELK